MNQYYPIPMTFTPHKRVWMFSESLGVPQITHVIFGLSILKSSINWGLLMLSDFFYNIPYSVIRRPASSFTAPSQWIDMSINPYIYHGFKRLSHFGGLADVGDLYF